MIERLWKFHGVMESYCYRNVTDWRRVQNLTYRTIDLGNNRRVSFKKYQGGYRKENMNIYSEDFVTDPDASESITELVDFMGNISYVFIMMTNGGNNRRTFMNITLNSGWSSPCFRGYVSSDDEYVKILQDNPKKNIFPIEDMKNLINKAMYKLL